MADADLEATFPEDGATVSGPPVEVAARFDEAIGTNSTIELIGPDGASLASGGLDPDDPARLVLAPPDDLAAGTYEVRWQAFSADGHLVRGTFEFTLAVGPSITPSPEATATPTSSAPPTAGLGPTDAPEPTASAPPGSGSTSGSAVVPIVAALAVLLVLAGILLRGRSRP